MSSMSYELRLFKRFLKSRHFVFFVRCELRLKKQLRTALLCVTMQHVVAISYQLFRRTNWSHLDFWILGLLKMGPIGCPDTSVIE